MKAKIRTADGFEEIKIIGEPFQIKSIWFFVHSKKYSKHKYSITEWHSGFQFTRAKTKAEIRPAINYIFEKMSMEIISHEIQEKIKKYGIANKNIPDNAKKLKAGIPP